MYNFCNSLNYSIYIFNDLICIEISFIMKKDENKQIEKMDEQLQKKLDKIIEQTKTENEALRKILMGLENLNNKSIKDN